MKTIYLTDQPQGHPNVKDVSNEIMFSITQFYKRTEKAENFRSLNFSDQHRLAEDSGGFQFLMGKLPIEKCDPLKTVEIYKKIGVTRKDFPIQLDLPPKYQLSKEERIALIIKSAEFYHIMAQEIDWTVPVVHGWTFDELQFSLELIENPEKLASGTFAATSARSKDKMSKLAGGTFFGSRYDWVMGKLNPHEPRAFGSRNMLSAPASDGGSIYLIDHLKSNPKAVGVGANKITPCVVDHVTSNKSVSAGTYLGLASSSQFILDHVTSDKSRVACGCFQQSGSFVCDTIANTPNRMKNKAIAAGAFNVKPGYGRRSAVVAVGSFNISQTPKLTFTGGKDPKIVGVGANQQSGRYVLNEAGNRKGHMVASPGCTAEQVVQKTPQKVIWERLAMVLNMFRDRQLFMLGAASPNDQHMIFLGGARYGDTSSWRLKAYLAEIYVPGRGSVAIGYKGKPKPTKEDLKILRESLKDPTHPLCGISLKRFLAIGKMNMKEWRQTLPANKWEIKPFDLRALHNAWVLKKKEEVIANEFANDPDSYYSYLLHHRFKGHPNLTRKLKFLWRRFKRPYVQDTLDVFLKGRS